MISLKLANGDNDDRNGDDERHQPSSSSSLSFSALLGSRVDQGQQHSSLAPEMLKKWIQDVHGSMAKQYIGRHKSKWMVILMMSDNHR